MRRPSVHITTFGCQMNKADSGRVAGLLKEAGYEIAPCPDEADVVLVNTCTVRQGAEDRALNVLRSARSATVSGLPPNSGDDRIKTPSMRDRSSAKKTSAIAATWRA